MYIYIFILFRGWKISRKIQIREYSENFLDVKNTCYRPTVGPSHVMKHLELNNKLLHYTLTDSQHGFRAKRSTETQLIQTIYDIYKSSLQMENLPGIRPKT